MKDQIVKAKPNNDAKPKLGRKEYTEELRKLQVELCELQD